MSGYDILQARCAACRESVIAEIDRLVRARGPAVGDLAALLLDYPLRPAKALRPTLCLSVASALGADQAAALPSAAALELLHNAFLIHDDVEDGSLARRGGPTLHELHGMPTAVNVADGMFALSLFPLLENCEHIGVGPALAVLETVAETVRITVEGQALELAWIRENHWPLGDGYEAAYRDLVLRKTAHYSFVAPVSIGCLVAGADPELRALLEDYARFVGVAFQTTDDVLNLEADEEIYGKEHNGDLWEGKRTLILMHAMAHTAAPDDRARGLEILALPRPSAGDARVEALLRELDRLHAQGRVDESTHAVLTAAASPQRAAKAEDDIRWLRTLIDRHGSIAAARAFALEQCARAGELLTRAEPWLSDGSPKEFLRDLVPYVTERLR